MRSRDVGIKAGDIDGDQVVAPVVRIGDTVAGIVEEADGVITGAGQRRGIIDQRAHNLIAFPVTHNADIAGLEAYALQRRHDQANVIRRVFQRADGGRIGLIGD
jgi:hypothetical protein